MFSLAEGGIPTPLQVQRPPCPALALPRLRAWPQVILSFLPGKMLQPGSQGRHLCHTAEPWHAPKGGRSPRGRCHTHPTEPLSPHTRCQLARCLVPLGLPPTRGFRTPSPSCFLTGRPAESRGKDISQHQSQTRRLFTPWDPVPCLISDHQVPVLSLYQALSLQSWFRGPCLKKKIKKNPKHPGNTQLSSNSVLAINPELLKYHE